MAKVQRPRARLVQETIAVGHIAILKSQRRWRAVKQVAATALAVVVILGVAALIRGEVPEAVSCVLFP